MRHRDAVQLLSPAPVDVSKATTWLDLGSGDGTFTLALADLLAPRSVIHALDVDRSALARIGAHVRVRIETHVADFTDVDRWPVTSVDGILIANSLHYVEPQREFLRACASRLRDGVLLVVEYDTDRANRYVPYPVSRDRLKAFVSGFGDVSILGSRASIYQRAWIYAAAVRVTDRQADRFSA
jgi:SAM-dependent methyltransferase